MKFTFHTKNLNERLYKRLIQYYLFVSLPNKWWYKMFNTWSIDIYPSDAAIDNKFFATTPERSSRGVGGVTGLGTITMFLEDTSANLNDPFLRSLRKNIIPTSHELGHAIGIALGWRNKVALRNDDWSGHKKGTKLNASTALIHDAHVEGQLHNMKVWVKSGGIFSKWKQITVQVLDMRRVIKQYEETFIKSNFLQ